ncbi:hypothetical protein, partial [Streptomyces sp. NPDC047453]|uniref:hypothetical protein n=1 Tax=Streptomyces sp. NPDC047453 TaxID=3154812 RepID=UPI0033C8157C
MIRSNSLPSSSSISRTCALSHVIVLAVRRRPYGSAERSGRHLIPTEVDRMSPVLTSSVSLLSSGLFGREAGVWQIPLPFCRTGLVR